MTIYKQLSSPYFKVINWALVLMSLGLFLLSSLLLTSLKAQGDQSVALEWLGEKTPSMSTGVSWGVPFAKGMVQPSSGYFLEDSEGNSQMVQSWPMAYWPDGSMKWVGFSTALEQDAGSSFILTPSDQVKNSGGKMKITENEESILINTGALQCVIPRQGNKLFSSLKVGNYEVSSKAELICILQDGPASEYGPQPEKHKLIGEIENVTVEQDGPVRSVVKIEGTHVSGTSTKTFLPFIIRMYFYSGQQTIKIVHTILYDGDQHSDFIRGLAVVFDLPMDEEVHNRHIRLGSKGGHFWSEPVQPMVGRRSLTDEQMYARQLMGQRVPQKETFSEREQSFLENWASWNDFKLTQNSADGYRIQKRTNIESAWIDAGSGERSTGLVFAGDVSGGLSVAIRNFWQSFPSSLEVRNARTETAQLAAWLWSPDGPEMDMRHYDTLAWGHGLEPSYEDVQPGLSTPTGIGRTSEILLFASSNVPSFDTLSALVELANDPPLLLTSPEYMHSIPVFGAWSLPDTTTNAKRWIEQRLDKAFDYYQLEVEQRNWYGFWDYGDVMHAYDKERHQWKYDIGGYAWDNSELVPNMWLWYSFLRSGKKDIFRMAEAMTRHTGEVDVYHIGRLAGLGSRHNVRHWGGGAKEVRISQAALSRFYYYLTTDERTGDLMRESVEASNKAIGELDPLRLILEKSKYPTHARMGPDWLALVGNWMTEWERTGDPIYKERILTGINSLYEMPYKLYSGKGAAMGYDPKTYKLYQLDREDIGYSHLSVLMGGPEVAFELTPLLDNDKWTEMWLQFCKLYGQPAEVIEKEFGKRAKLGDAELWYSRLPAYYAHKTGEVPWAEKAWNDFLSKSGRDRGVYTNFDLRLAESPHISAPVYEVEGVSTNNTAQWCLNAIELLYFIGDKIPEDHARFTLSNN